MFIVEGNIGAGKSTFLKLMQQHLPHITTALEPVALWDTPHQGNSLLESFMLDTRRWAYTMETFTMMCRVREHLYYQQKDNPFFVVERSIYSGHYVFALNGYRQGFMTEQEWQMYLQYFHYLIPGWCKPPRGFIYVRTHPEIAYERIQKRNRVSEAGISLEYLKQVHDMHEEFLIRKENILQELQQVPVLVLDGDRDFEGNFSVRQECSHMLHAFLMQQAGDQNV
jgi:deoxyadenosine/deoxycytidine kinase